MSQSIFLIMKRVALHCCFVILFSSYAFSQTTLNPSQDAYVTQQLPTTNTNNYNLAVDYTYYASSWCRSVALLKFDVSQFNGMSITHAELRLTAGDGAIAGTSMLNARYIESTWAETSVTWNTRPAVGGTIETNGTSGVIYPIFDVTSAVQAWVSGSHINNGFWIEGNQNSSYPYSFGYYDKENGQAGTKPQLIIQATSLVTLTSPNSGSYTAGSICPIVWTTTSIGSVGVRITLSIDNGDSFPYLITNYTTSRNYPWPINQHSTSPQLPNLVQYPQNNVKIRIEDVIGGGVDTSDGSVSILGPPDLVINSPYEGSVQRTNNDVSISWTPANMLNIDIYLSKNGGLTFTQVPNLQNIPNTGSAVWHSSVEEDSCNVIGICYSDYGGYFESGAFLVIKPLLFIESSIQTSPTTYVPIQQFFELDTIPHNICTLTDITDGTIDTDDYSVIILSQNAYMAFPSYLYDDVNVIVCRDGQVQSDYLQLPPSFGDNARIDFNNRRLEFNPQQSACQLLTPPIKVNWSNALQYFGVKFIDAILSDDNNEFNSILPVVLSEDGMEKKFVSVMQSVEQTKFIAIWPKIVTRTGGGINAVSFAAEKSAIGARFGLWTIIDSYLQGVWYFNDAKCSAPDLNIAINYREDTITNYGELSVYMDKIVDGEHLYRYTPNGRNMIQNSNNVSTIITSTTADLLKIAYDGVKATGILSINSQRVSEPIEYTIRKTNSPLSPYALVDINDDSFMYTGTEGQTYLYNFSDSGVFQPELNFYQVSGCNANTAYCTYPFNISENGRLSTFSVLPSVDPVSPAQAASDMYLTVTTGIDTGVGGTLMVSIIGSDAPPQYQFISSQTCSEENFMFFLHSSTQGTQTYNVLLQFRPSVFTDHINTTNVGDIVLNLAYTVIWAGSGLASPQNLTISVTSLGVYLAWNPVQGASYYKIYASNNPYSGYEYIGQAFIASYSTASGNKKFYRVTAFQ